MKDTDVYEDAFGQPVKIDQTDRQDQLASVASSIPEAKFEAKLRSFEKSLHLAWIWEAGLSDKIASCAQLGGLSSAHHTCTGCENEMSFVGCLPFLDWACQIWFCFLCAPQSSQSDQDGCVLEGCLLSDVGSSYSISDEKPSKQKYTSFDLMVLDRRPSLMAPVCDTLNMSPSEWLMCVDKISCARPQGVYTGGYPSIEIDEPVCAHCNGLTHFFGQIDSLTHPQMVWGNFGVLCLFQCVNNPTHFNFLVKD